MAMVVYQNTNSVSQSTRKTRTWNGNSEMDPSTLTLVGSQDLVYRQGKRRRKPRYLDNTPYELRIINLVNGRGRCDITAPSSPRWRREMTGVIGELRVVDTSYRHGSPFSVSAEYADVARVKALSKLNRKDLDLGAAWKERGRTAQLVGDVALFSVNALQALRRKDATRLRDVLTGTDAQGVVSGLSSGGRNLVDGYLAYHYGVKPMLQDVSGAVQAMTRLPPESWRIQATAQHSRDSQKNYEGMKGDTWRRFATSLRESARFQVSAVRRNTSRADDIRWALGLDDPLSTAWEVTPFSFVFDWIVPVGDWLAALNGSKYYTNWLHSLSEYRKETTIEQSASGRSNGYRYDSSISDGRLETTYVKRTIGTSLPIVGVPMKDPRSLDHMAKGLALFASTLARGGEPPRFIRG